MFTAAKFQSLWRSACGEDVPDPRGAAGALMAAIGEVLNVAQVEYAQINREALFLFDLSSLGFKGMDLNVVMIGHPPDDEEEARAQVDLLSDYKTALKSVGLCFQIFLSDDLPDGNRFVPSSLDAVFISGSDLRRLFASRIPDSVFFEIIRRQLPLQRLCPFNTTHAARGSMFRGRRFELEQLIGDLDTNFVVSGARRIGKTSLMTRAYDSLRIRPEFRDRVFWFNCLTWGGPDDCFHRLAHRIDPRKEPRIHYGSRNVSYMLERRSRRGSRPLVLFFDELDRVVDEDSIGGWPFFDVLAEAASEDQIRVVFAGYRSMGRLSCGKGIRLAGVSTGPDSPFHGSLQDVALAPLSQNDCHSLISEPFVGVDIRIREKEAVLDKIWKGTAGHPFLIQFYGEKLFHRASQRESQEIVLDDVTEIEGDFELSDFLSTHFRENTLDHNGPVREERVCAFLYAHLGGKDGWTESDFVQKCHQHDRRFTQDEIHAALRNLVRASVFAFRHGRHTFAFPLIGQVLRESYPDLSLAIQSVEE